MYKGGQAGITKATVTITFDNTDKRQSPVGYESYDEITVSRQVKPLQCHCTSFLRLSVCLSLSHLLTLSLKFLSSLLHIIYNNLHQLDGHLTYPVNTLSSSQQTDEIDHRYRLAVSHITSCSVLDTLTAHNMTTYMSTYLQYLRFDSYIVTPPTRPETPS